MATASNTRRLLALAVGLLAVLVVLSLLGFGAGLAGYGPMHRGWGGGMWGGGMWGNGTAPGWLVLVGVGMQLLVLAVVALLGYLVYRALTGRDGTDRALEELRLAYARGDLSDEEYQARRDALTSES